MQISIYWTWYAQRYSGAQTGLEHYNLVPLIPIQSKVAANRRLSKGLGGRQSTFSPYVFLTPIGCYGQSSGAVTSFRRCWGLIWSPLLLYGHGGDFAEYNTTLYQTHIWWKPLSYPLTNVNGGGELLDASLVESKSMSKGPMVVSPNAPDAIGRSSRMEMFLFDIKRASGGGLKCFPLGEVDASIIPATNSVRVILLSFISSSNSFPAARGVSW